MGELKACPFCGRQPEADFESVSVPGMEDCGYHYVMCCDVHVHRDTEAEAIAAWNTRPAPSEAEVEAAARAMWNAIGPRYIPWERNLVPTKERYLRMARAALGVAEP